MPSPSRGPYYSVSFADSDTGVAVGVIRGGGYGTIVRTTDAGQNWTAFDSVFNTIFTGAHFVDRHHAWIVGVNGKIFRTGDSGVSWEDLSVGGVNNNFTSVFFVSPSTGWITGQTNIIRKTVNGGSSWTNQTSGLGPWWSSIFFINADTGWAVNRNLGMPERILKTTNGGTWVNQVDLTSAQLHDVFFANQDTGFAVGSGIIMKTTNGGTTWQTSNIGQISLNSVHFTDSRTGWAVGGAGTILKTTNCGETWLNQPSGLNAMLWGVYFTNSDSGFAVGDTGVILRTTNGGGPTLSVGETERPHVFELEQNYPNPFNPATHIEFRIPARPAGGANFGFVSLKVFDVLGREVATLVNEVKAPGIYGVTWNASGFPSGVYLYQLRSGSLVQTKKLVLIK
ncbi:MAG: T9SS type A sorting domain-containing protein [Bacteroidetes bacterium]|nr:T9SS type A sorting domain-containing protein [Bacteroidota bacterium]MCW5894400.1 T9SS type A sorting domain-containing protein [Bacteroidota bacterium]